MKKNVNKPVDFTKPGLPDDVLNVPELPSHVLGLIADIERAIEGRAEVNTEKLRIFLQAFREKFQKNPRIPDSKRE